MNLFYYYNFRVLVIIEVVMCIIHFIEDNSVKTILKILYHTKYIY